MMGYTLKFDFRNGKMVVYSKHIKYNFQEYELLRDLRLYDAPYFVKN